MTQLFNRKYKLTVGESGGQGKQFDELNIRFKVELTGDSAPNKAEIEIFNLSSDSRNYVAKNDLAIILEAGYEKNFGRIFAGFTTFTHQTKGTSRKDDEIRRGIEQRRKNDSDWISKIEADDGVKALKHFIIISLSDDNLTELGVLNKVVDKLNETVKVSKGVLTGVKGIKINHGKAYTGTFKSIMDSICDKQKLQWHIFGGVLNVYPIGEALNQDAIKLDYSSGLVGSPEPTEKGYKFSSLLRHEIVPGSLIEVEAEQVKGRFVVANVTHAGEYEFSTQWNTVCECIPLKLK